MDLKVTYQISKQIAKCVNCGYTGTVSSFVSDVIVPKKYLKFIIYDLKCPCCRGGNIYLKNGGNDEKRIAADYS